MSDRPTPETDAETMRDEYDHVDSDLGPFAPSDTVTAEFARLLERERDEARELLKKALVRGDLALAETKKAKENLFWSDHQDKREIQRERDEARESLKHIGEYGTEEINAAIDLRQKLASALVERDEAQKELSSIHRWIERNHADGFIDSLTHLQNLERVTDSWYDRIDAIETDARRFVKERDEAREQVKKLRKALLRVRTWGISSKNFSATDSYKMAEWIDDGCEGELPKPNGSWIYEKMEETK